MALFETDVILPVPVEQVFEFLLRPANVALISPPQLGLIFVNPPEIVQPGTELSFKIQSYGQVQTFTHRIDEVIRPEKIVERQIEGLFRKWFHEHLFEAVGSRQTRVIDRIEFEPPGGVLGFLVTKSRIIEQLEEGFDHRHARLESMFPSTG